MVATPAEGIVLDEEYVSKIQALAKEFYKDNSFGYISNRIHDYSRNLSPKSYTRQFPILKAIAIVYKTENTLKVAEFESYFIQIPFSTFSDLEAAKQWMLSRISSEE